MLSGVGGGSNPLPAPSGAAVAAHSAVLPGFARVPAARVRIAAQYARARSGRVAFSVIDGHGRQHSLGGQVRFYAASVAKVLLLAAYLRGQGRAGIHPHLRYPLERMIIVSDNDAADLVYAQVGDRGLRSAAYAGGMRRFSVSGHWGNAVITAKELARFMINLPAIIPGRHRRYAESLLEGITVQQRWGIPAAVRHRFRVLFKGGWRPTPVGRLEHQAALLRRGGHVVGLAVLTDAQPSHEYGTATIRGVAARLLRER
jgi:hypothetical protein